MKTAATIMILFSILFPPVIGSVLGRDIWFEGWETTQVGTYIPGANDRINGDMGTWAVDDTVSSECPEPTPHTAEILESGERKYLRLTARNSNSECADNIWVTLADFNPVNVSITQDTVLSFEEYGNRGAEIADDGGSYTPSLSYTCYLCAIGLYVEDNQGHVIFYALQEHPWFEPLSISGFKSMILGGSGGIYTRNLYEDFMEVDGLFEMDTSWAIIDNILITVTGGPDDGQAAKLAFLTSPGNTAAWSNLTPNPAVAVQDASGNTVTSSTASITVNIKTGTGTTEATLLGTKTVNV